MAILKTSEAAKLPHADAEIGTHPERLALEQKLPPGARVRHHLELTPTEVAAGYVRPLWHTWQHVLCGSVQPLRFGDAARELARNPQLVDQEGNRSLLWNKGLHCLKCNDAVKIGPDGFAVWVDYQGRPTPVKVGT